MRTIRYTSRFKRDCKRQKAGQRGKMLDGDLTKVVKMLAADIPLPRTNFDHLLTGGWRDHRDCSVQPDLILIYRKPDDRNLDLVRLGSHSSGRRYRLGHSKLTRSGYSSRLVPSFRSDTRKFDNLRPLFSIPGDELAEIGCRAAQCGSTQVGEESLHTGNCKSGIDPSV